MEGKHGDSRGQQQKTQRTLFNNHGNPVTRKTGQMSHGVCKSVQLLILWSLDRAFVPCLCPLIYAQAKFPQNRILSQKTGSSLVTAAPLGTPRRKLCPTLKHTTRTAQPILQRWQSEHRCSSAREKKQPRLPCGPSGVVVAIGAGDSGPRLSEQEPWPWCYQGL